MADNRSTEKKNRLFGVASVISLSLGALSAIILLISISSPDFASFFNMYVSGSVRVVLAYITNFIPFSLAELLIILFPIAVTLLIVYTVKNKQRRFAKHLVTLLSAVSIFFSSFVFSFGTGYHTPSLYDRFDISERSSSVSDLKSAAISLVGEINLRIPYINYDSNGSSIMPYSMDKMNELLVDAYEPISEKYDFVQNFDSNIKPVLLSRAMAYAHIAGVYTFFTGEANLSVDPPDYSMAFTAAHELAHQRGIAREDEANFFAFLACLSSKDIYLEYCAYITMFEHVAAALYRADPDFYKEIVSYLSSPAKGEISAYSNYFKKFESSVAGKVSASLNNSYLIVNGAEEGKKSYGLVVDLTVAYFKGLFD